MHCAPRRFCFFFWCENVVSVLLPSFGGGKKERRRRRKKGRRGEVSKERINVRIHHISCSRIDRCGTGSPDVRFRGLDGGVRY